MRKFSVTAGLVCAWMLGGCGTAPLPPDTPPSVLLAPAMPTVAVPADASAVAPRADDPTPRAETYPVLRGTGTTGAIVPEPQSAPAVIMPPPGTAPAPGGMVPGGAPPGMPTGGALPDGVPPGAAVPVRMALLLPLQSETLGSAARAVRDGFMAAYQRDPVRVTVTEVDTTDTPAQIVGVYEQTQREHDLVVGPLLRQAVTAVIQNGRVRKPTIALNQPESLPSGDPADLPLPPNLLLMGLSVEEEARQAARWAETEHPRAPAWAVYGHSGWQKRAARAFAAARLAQGLPTRMLQVAPTPGDLRNADLGKLQDGLRDTPGAVLFFALDPDTARDARQAVGPAVPAYATSQINPNVLTAAATPYLELNGVRLLDMPWQIQGDYAPAQPYPRPVVEAGGKPNADLARLYALGVDAYRVAREIAVAGRRDFTLDGLTGRLTVRSAGGVWQFERETLPAVYRDGVAQPWQAAP